MSTPEQTPLDPAAIMAAHCTDEDGECEGCFADTHGGLVLWPCRTYRLAAELERLHSWDGLMSLLDEHWPEDVFPTVPDDASRDPGPRIVALLRVRDRLAAALAAAEVQIEPGYLGTSYERPHHFDCDGTKCGVR